MPSSVTSYTSSASKTSSSQDLHHRETSVKKTYISNTVDDLKQVFSDSPELNKGVLKGVRFTGGRYQDLGQDNYLFSLDARDSTIVTLYNPHTQKGVVHHFEDKARMEKEIRKSIDFLGGFRHADQIEANIVGGVWFGAGEKIGNRIREALRSYQIEPAWNDWSFTPCYGHRYGAILHLKHGNLTVFEHTSDIATQFKQDKWQAAESKSRSSSGVSSSSSDISAVADNYHLQRFGSRLSISSIDSLNRFHASQYERKTLKNSVGDVEYSLIGAEKYVKRFRNLFNAKLDDVRGELSKKSFPEIRAYLEGTKQALPDAEKIDLHIVKPRRDRASLGSLSDVSSIFSVDSLHLAEEAEIHSIFSNTFVNQELFFSEDQKKIMDRTVNQIIDGINDGTRSKAHSAEVFLFSASDQEKIQEEFGDGTSKLYAVTLAGWESSDKGRGKWRLLYKRQDDGIHFFGVYDTHRKPYVAYLK